MKRRGYQIDRQAKKGIRAIQTKQSKEDALKESGKSGRIKGTRKTEVDGIIFDSKREAVAYNKLRLMAKAGLIEELQVNASLRGEQKIKYQLRFDDVVREWYEPDFVYIDAKTKEKIVADAKGHQTDTYKKKKRMMKKVYGIDILEI